MRVWARARVQPRMQREMCIARVAQENRRHARVVKKASKLAISDLLEIAAMKGMRAEAPEIARSSAVPAGTHNGEASSSSASSASSAVAIGEAVATVAPCLTAALALEAASAADDADDVAGDDDGM